MSGNGLEFSSRMRRALLTETIKTMRMKTNNIYLALGIAISGLFAFTACDKNDGAGGGTTKVEVRMTDAPGNFDEINLHVKEIMLKSGEQSYTFAAEANWFNILDYRIGTNNPDILVASGEMPSGDITEIRLVLDDGNTIVVNGVEHALTTPSGQSSGWKVKLTENPVLVPGVTYTLLLDFDAAKSIVQTGNGKYMLKPVVRGVTAATSGLISGSVLPLESYPEILAIRGVDTIGTVADPLTGTFTIGGLEEGTYSLKIIPVDTLNVSDSTITNVSVSLGQNTNVGVIDLGN